MENNRANRSSSRAPSGRSEHKECQTRVQRGALIVDDDGLVRLMLRLALERDGFQVWVAASGREAISLYEQHRSDIQIVLLEAHMPILDGPRTLSALQKIDPNVRACFLSGESAKYTSKDLICSGAWAVFRKPFRLLDLVNAVRQLLAGESQGQFSSRSPEMRIAATFAEDFAGPVTAEVEREVIAV